MADESSALTAKFDSEREMLLSRINHLDTLALAARAIVVPVTIVAAISCIGSGVMPMRPLPGNIQFLLPLSVIAAFYIIELRIRAKYLPCRKRWQRLIKLASAVEAGRQFNWIKTRSAWSEFSVFYALLAAVVILMWLVKHFGSCIAGVAI